MKISIYLGAFLFLISSSSSFAQSSDCSSWSVTAMGARFTNTFCASGFGSISIGPEGSKNSVEISSDGKVVSALVNQSAESVSDDIPADKLLSCAKTLALSGEGLNADQRAQVLATLDVLNALKDLNSGVDSADAVESLFGICMEWPDSEIL